MTASRRTFLKGASALAASTFLLGTYLPLGRTARAQHGAAPAAAFDPNVFLKIDADNVVTLISKYFEMGQGVTTGLATLVAEELDANWTMMRYAFAPNNVQLYNNLVFGPVMATGGSTSMMGSFDQMRQVGAAARAMLVAAAAARWGVPAGTITVANGILSHAAAGKRATLGAFATDAMRLPVPAQVSLKDPKDWKLIGTTVPRLDSDGKTTGTTLFALDVRRPGAVTAVLQRPTRFGATVASVDASAAKQVAGVLDVLQVPQGVAVIAKDTWSAIRGRAALKVRWDTSRAENRSSAAIFDEYRQMMSGSGLSAQKRGDAAAKLAGAARTYEAEFTFPYLAHTPMEPLNATMELKPDGAEIWSGCQLQSIDEHVAAHVLGLTPDRIKINTLHGGGSFGRRGNPTGDLIGELAAITKAYGGRAPVHLVWTREDDVKGGFYRAMVVHRVKVGLDAGGNISGWDHRIATKSIFTGTPFEPMAVKNNLDASSVEGVVDSAYELSDFDVRCFNVTSPIPVLWLRSVGHSHAAHVMESTIDELAHLAGKDPIDFRAALLSGKPRDLAVLNLAKERSGWGASLPEGRGRGVAYHVSFGTRICMVADVTVWPTRVKVDRIVAVVDCGVAINPDIVKAQVEGAIGFTLSSALRNQITLRDGEVEQSNFDDYEPTRMREMPQVDVHIVKSLERPSGIGEPGVAPVAPAIANAIFAATGKRLRSLPLGGGTRA